MMNCVQMSLFDYMDEDKSIHINPVEKKEPPILLKNGQHVYKLVKAEIYECVVDEEKSWICGTNDRGYRLRVIGGCWDCTWNKEIGINCFTTLAEAEKESNKKISEYVHIKKEQILPVRTVAYQYKHFENIYTNFYCVLPDGKIYSHFGSMYEHITSKTKEEIKKFEEQRRNHIKSSDYKELSDFNPTFKTMYKCSNLSSWEYAEARYRG